MEKQIVKLSFMINVEALIDKDKGQLTDTDILSVANYIDTAVRDYNDSEIIYPPNRPDFELKLIRTYKNTI